MKEKNQVGSHDFKMSPEKVQISSHIYFAAYICAMYSPSTSDMRMRK